MDKEYLCIEELALQKCDEDGFVIDNDLMIVEKFTTWVILDSRVNDGVHTLTRCEDNSWIEIDTDTLERHFAEIL